MNVAELMRTLADHFATANQSSIYGQPVSAAGKTIVPVARIRYGFGCGGGAKGGEEGGGGGGGVNVIPVGVVEVSAAGTRFIPIGRGRLVAAALTAGAIAGMWAGWRGAQRRLQPRKS